MADRLPLFVVGAHLSGMPLNKQLTDVGAELEGEVFTDAVYRLFVLPNTTPPKPGLVRDADGQGAAIIGEIWRLEAGDFGRFVAAIPAPLGVGKVKLSDGREVSGFLCEAYAANGGREITALGGWRAYCDAAKRVEVKTV